MGTLYHLDVGCADAHVIKTSSATFLVDCHNIENHKQLLPSSKSLRGVFITHQHSDHYSGLGYLRRNGYSIDCLIYCPYVRRYNDSSVTLEEWNEFKGHREYFEGKGTRTYKVFRQNDMKEPWWDTNGAKFWIIGPARSIATKDTRELHDACLVITAKLNNRTCCFTGDASDANLNYVANKTSNYCNDILSASHHGSINGADLEFIKGAKSKHTVVSTKSGVYENVPHPTAMQQYRTHSDKVSRTDGDGTQKFTF